MRAVQLPRRIPARRGRRANRAGARTAGRGPERGQATVEVGLALAVFLLLVLGATEFGIYEFRESVVLGACQDGARVAAEAGRSPDEGVVTARSLLEAGLGGEAAAVTLQAGGNAAVVVLEAHGEMRLLIPALPLALPLYARVEMPRG